MTNCSDGTSILIKPTTWTDKCGLNPLFNRFLLNISNENMDRESGKVKWKKCNGEFFSIKGSLDWI